MGHHNWLDQYDAHVIILESFGSGCSKAAKRISPNRANKALRQKINECERLSGIKGRFPKISLFRHRGPVNNYHLAMKSRISVVSRSMLPMELIALGVLLVTMFPTCFSENLKLPNGYSPKSLSKFDFDNIAVPDIDEAKRLAEYLMVGPVV